MAAFWYGAGSAWVEFLVGDGVKGLARAEPGWEGS